MENANDEYEKQKAINIAPRSADQTNYFPHC